ncbi:hypothetical protein [Desulfogranum japonicum]|uniref:hypothetical protein n=1 Tax=Desulfogranum japonicum TaxID=231447 RepID=UPI000491CC78|nr:hypothetical protein [Desulfogranum japonicum]
MIKYLLGIPLFIGIFIISLFFFLLPGLLALGGVFELFKNHKWPKIIVGSIVSAAFFTPVHCGGHNMFFVPLILSPISEQVTFYDLLTKWKVFTSICIASISFFSFTFWYEKNI